MTGLNYRDAITKLGLSINASGRFFGVGQATAHRWVVDGCPMSVDILIRLMLVLHVKPAWVNLMIGRKQEGD